MESGEKSRLGIPYVLGELSYLSKIVGKVLLTFYLPLVTLLTLVHFPYDTDASARAEASHQRSASYYEAAYQRNDQKRRGLDYEESARQAAVNTNAEGLMRQFANRYGLEHKRVLEVGSGRGYLQDIVPDYTGLDLSASVAGRYHKPFVVASATAMPFPDNSFDAIWTLWTLEHIPEPEAALREMRRVVKPAGIIFLAAAWNYNLGSGWSRRSSLQRFQLARQTGEGEYPCAQFPVFHPVLPAAHTWYPMADLPTGRRGYALVSIEGRASA